MKPVLIVEEVCQLIGSQVTSLRVDCFRMHPTIAHEASATDPKRGLADNTLCTHAAERLHILRFGNVYGIDFGLVDHGLRKRMQAVAFEGGNRQPSVKVLRQRQVF